MKHCTMRTALKYGAASCGEEYTPGNDHVGFKWISRKPIKMFRGQTDEGEKRPVTCHSRLLVVRCVRCARCGVSWHRNLWDMWYHYGDWRLLSRSRSRTTTVTLNGKSPESSPNWQQRPTPMQCDAPVRALPTNHPDPDLVQFRIKVIIKVFGK